MALPKNSSPKQSPGFLLWRVTNLWQRHIRQALREVDLTHVQFVLLDVTANLSDTDGPVNQVKIADSASTDKMMTSQVLRTLEQKGLVVRAPDPADRRAMNIGLSDAGRRLIGRAIQLVEEADAKFFSTLGESQDELARMLSELAESAALGPEVGD